MKIADTLSSISLLAFDTVPLIYFIERNPTYIVQMREIMQQIADENLKGTASFLTLTEVLIHPIKIGDATLVQQYETILTKSKNFRLAVIGDTTSRKAAELRALYNLKTPDALHVASAIVTNADAFLTNDKGLRRINEIDILLLDDLQV